MATDQALPIHDLRGPAVDYKRDKTHSAKWALGERTAARSGLGERLQWSPGLAQGSRRPIHPRAGAKNIKARHSRNGATNKKPRQASKVDPRGDQAAAASGTSGTSDSDLESCDSGGCEDDDEGITYSYDAPTGPGRGSHILSSALTDAVVRFEGKQTDKLVREEYEVVQPGSPALVDSDRGVKDVGGAVEADGFELV